MAYKFYIGQTLATLTLVVNSNFNLNGAINAAILYQKPDGTTGQVSATISGQSIVYNIADEIESEDTGRWYFQGRFIKDGETEYTEIEQKDIKVLQPII